MTAGCRSGASAGLTGSRARSSSSAPSEAPERLAKGAVVHVGGEPAEIVESKRAGGRPVIRLDRPVDRGAELLVAARGAAAARTRTRTTSSSSWGLRSRRTAAARSAACRTSSPASRTTSSCSTRASACRSSTPACARSTWTRAPCTSCPASAATGNLGWPPYAARHLHPRSARLRECVRAAAARVGARLRARAAPLQLPRHDAAARRPGRRRAVRRRRRHGAAGRRRRRRARRRVRRPAVAPRRRAHAAGPPADAGGRRRAGRRGARDAPVGPLRGLRRARRRAPGERRDLDRPVRPLGRRAARDGDRRRGRPPAAGRARQRGVRAWRRASRPSSKAGSSTRTTRGRPSSAAGTVPDVLLSGDHGRVGRRGAREQSRLRSAA